MKGESSASRIKCPIGLFHRVEIEVKDITQAMNTSSNAQEKAKFAEELRQVVTPLLNCTAYEASNINCQLCRQFSLLRDRTAALVCNVSQRNQ